VAVLVTWTFMYYFVFEMQELRDLLESEHPEERVKRVKTTKNKWKVTIIVLVVSDVIATAL
jgi:hypothetical protein